MSDLYLELRTRIPVVAQRTVIGTQRLQDAQDAVGLSNEAVARRVPVSEKTWRRWKEAGEIPTASLPAVASALRLDLHELKPPEPEPVTGRGEDPEYQALREEVTATRAMVEAILAHLGVDVPEATPPREGASRGLRAARR